MAENTNKKQKKFPDDFESEDDFVAWCRKTFLEDLSADEANRNAAIEDSEFAAGEQWSAETEADRVKKQLPVLTLNRIPAILGTIIGNRRQNDVTVKIVPDYGGTKQTAKLRQGLVRSILKTSTAQRALDKAFENQIICGIGNFGVNTVYANDDVFEQDLSVYAIAHALAVVWDRHAIDPTGADAHHVFVVERVANEEFKRRYKGATVPQFGGEVDRQARFGDWFGANDARVGVVWYMSERTRTLAMMNDGNVIDITDMTEADRPIFEASVARHPNTGEPVVRESPVKYACRYVISGFEVLESGPELRTYRVPVFRAEGWVVNIGERRARWGVVRFIKDAQRLFNFWRSVIAEKLQYTPRATIMASDLAIQGREEDWKKAHVRREPLIWNAESGQKPDIIPPTQMEPALLNEAAMAAQDMREITNIHEANLGQTSNEVSGKAILARQRVGELGLVIYSENMDAAIEECGRVLNDLLQYYYDTPRIVKVIGEDDAAELVAINTEPLNDLTAGKYSVSVTTGPSYVTKRIEAAESMLNLINAMPQVMAVAADKIVEAQDWPGAEEIAKRLRATLPPELVGQEDITPEQQAAQQAAAQMQQQQAELQMAAMMADVEYKRAQARQADAQAREAMSRSVESQARAAAALDGAETDRIRVIGKVVNDESKLLMESEKTRDTLKTSEHNRTMDTFRAVDDSADRKADREQRDRQFQPKPTKKEQ